MVGVLRGRGFKGYQLALMYYFICIVLRLGFAGLVWKFGEERWMLFTVLGLGLLGAGMNIRGMRRIGVSRGNSSIWWSREFHLLSAVAVSVLALSGLMGWIPHLEVVRRWMVVVLVVDVLVGVVMSAHKRPFF